MIGIIGQGFVGNAIYQKFKNYFDVLTYDLDKSKSNSKREDLIFKSDTQPETTYKSKNGKYQGQTTIQVAKIKK